MTFECRRCHSHATQVAWIIAFKLSMGAASFFLSRGAVKKAESAHFHAMPNPLIKLSMSGVSFFQTVSFMSRFDYEWPEAIASLFGVFSVTYGSAGVLVSHQLFIPDPDPNPNPNLTYWVTVRN